jgi:hypothetical protein
MALGELLIHKIDVLLMDSGKMEYCMDIVDQLIKMVPLKHINMKMVMKLENSELFKRLILYILYFYLSLNYNYLYEFKICSKIEYI